MRSHSPSRSVRLSRRGTVQSKWHATAVRSNRSVFPAADPRRRRALQPQISTAQKRRSTIGAADDASLEHQGSSVRNVAVPVSAPPLATPRSPGLPRRLAADARCVTWRGTARRFKRNPLKVSAGERKLIGQSIHMHDRDANVDAGKAAHVLRHRELRATVWPQRAAEQIALQIYNRACLPKSTCQRTASSSACVRFTSRSAKRKRQRWLQRSL